MQQPAPDWSEKINEEGTPVDPLDANRSRNRIVITTDGTRLMWLDDARLSTEGFSANGLTRDMEGTLYVAVTQTAEETGRLLEVPVTADGATGEPTVFYEGEAILSADGITARDGDVHVAANNQNRVVQVTSDGSTTTVADEDDGLVFSSDVTFDPGQQRETLFIYNFANQSPEDGAILRTEF